MPTKTIKKWTDDDHLKLQEMAGCLPLETIAGMLGRSKSSVKAYANRKGIQLKPEYNNLSARNVALMLGVHPSSVQRMVKRSNLRVTRSPGKKVYRLTTAVMKRLYEKYPKSRVFRDAPQSTIDWLIGDL